jgi:hypothetical protein
VSKGRDRTGKSDCRTEEISLEVRAWSCRHCRKCH